MSNFVDRARELFPGRDFIGFYNDGVYIAAPGRAGEMRALVDGWGESYLPPRWKETLSADVEQEARDFWPMFQREIRRVSYPWTPTLRYRGAPLTSDEAALEEDVERKLAAIGFAKQPFLPFQWTKKHIPIPFEPIFPRGGGASWKTADSAGINSWWKQPAPAPEPEPDPLAPFRAAYERARRASLKKELRARKRERESWSAFDAYHGFDRDRPLRRLVRIEHALRSPGGMARLAIMEDLERDLLRRIKRNNAAWQRLAPPAFLIGDRINIPLH